MGGARREGVRGRKGRVEAGDPALGAGRGPGTLGDEGRGIQVRDEAGPRTQGDQGLQEQVEARALGDTVPGVLGSPAFCRVSMFWGLVASSATICTNWVRAFWYCSNTAGRDPVERAAPSSPAPAARRRGARPGSYLAAPASGS